MDRGLLVPAMVNHFSRLSSEAFHTLCKTKILAEVPRQYNLKVHPYLSKSERGDNQTVSSIPKCIDGDNSMKLIFVLHHDSILILKDSSLVLDYSSNFNTGRRRAVCQFDW